MTPGAAKNIKEKNVGLSFSFRKRPPLTGAGKLWTLEIARKGLLDPASKRPLALVRNGVAPVQLWGDLCSLGPKGQKDL